jgi:hypothetical protein
MGERLSAWPMCDYGYRMTWNRGSCVAIVMVNLRHKWELETPTNHDQGTQEEPGECGPTSSSERARKMTVRRWERIKGRWSSIVEVL